MIHALSSLSLFPMRSQKTEVQGCSNGSSAHGTHAHTRIAAIKRVSAHIREEAAAGNQITTLLEEHVTLMKGGRREEDISS